MSLVPSSPKVLRAHIFERDPFEHYVEPRWVSYRIFEEIKFDGPLLDPWAGWGRFVTAAEAHGYETICSDIVDRGAGELRRQGCFRVLDFLAPQKEEVYAWWRRAPCIVGNPPFNEFEKHARRALTLARSKVALVWLLGRLPAAMWLKELPLRRTYYLTPRPSMPTGEFIEKVGRREIDPKTGKPFKLGGGSTDFCVLLFEHGYRGEPGTAWIDRDAGSRKWAPNE